MATGGQSDQRTWKFSFLNKEWPWIQSLFFKEQNIAAMVWSTQQSYTFPNLQLCKWGLFCPAGMLRHSFCCSLAPWRIFVILQDSLFSLREEIQGSCWCLCTWVGGCSCTEGSDQGMLAVSLLLQPCEAESGSWLPSKNPQTVPMLSFDSLHCHLCPHAPPHTFSAVKDLSYQ